MKITLFFCVVAVVATSSCLATALPPCVSNCVQKCQSPSTDVPCVKSSLFRDTPGTMTSLVAVLCAFDRYLGTGDIAPLTTSIQRLGSLPDCSTADIMPYLMNGGVRGLVQTVLGYVTVLSGTTNVVSPCTPLVPLLAKITSKLGGAPLLGGIKETPTTVPVVNPGLVNALLDTVKRLLQAVLGNNAGLVENLLGPLGNILGPAGGYNDQSGKGLLDGVTSIAPTNPKGGSSTVTGIVNGVLPVVNGVTSTLLGSLAGNPNGGSGPGLLDSVGPLVNGLTSNLLGPIAGNPNGGSGSGLLNSVGPLVNGVTSNLLGSIAGNPNGGSGSGLLNSVGPLVNGVTSNLLGSIAGNPNGGSGSGLLNSVGPLVNGVTSNLLGSIAGNPNGGSGQGLLNTAGSLLGSGVLKPVLGMDPFGQLPLVGNILSPMSSNNGYSNIQSETTGSVYGYWQPNSDSTLEASFDLGINAGPTTGFQSNWASSSGNGGFSSNPQVSGTSMDPYSSLLWQSGK
ncbi:secreted protein C-like [Xenopus laevis]|uniref:Secreted protein C-like n=1 Tax=Xenopus laevis TaxID=8355 RepID=A0A8J1MLV0_XENLA|nr:secreted protein C-like [Xenopus laevis]